MPTQRSASYLDEVTTEETIVTSGPAPPVLVVPLDDESAHGLSKLFSNFSQDQSFLKMC